MPDQRRADASATPVPAYSHANDLGLDRALARQAGHKDELEAADHGPVLDRHDQAVARLPLHGGEGVEVGLRQGVLRALAGSTQRVVGEQADDGRQVVAGRGPEVQGGSLPSSGAAGQADAFRQPAARMPAPIRSEPPVLFTARCRRGCRSRWRAAEARRA